MMLLHVIIWHGIQSKRGNLLHCYEAIQWNWIMMLIWLTGWLSLSLLFCEFLEFSFCPSLLQRLKELQPDFFSSSWQTQREKESCAKRNSLMRDLNLFLSLDSFAPRFLFAFWFRFRFSLCYITSLSLSFFAVHLPLVSFPSLTSSLHPVLPLGLTSALETIGV